MGREAKDFLALPLADSNAAAGSKKPDSSAAAGSKEPDSNAAAGSKEPENSFSDADTGATAGFKVPEKLIFRRRKNQDAVAMRTIRVAFD